ncbi:MAG: class I SAM-dependent methyltransferase [Sinimarinibacterium sp.]
MLAPPMAALSDGAGLRAQRRRLLSSANGATLEIHGFGTGRNLGLYGDAITELVLVQPANHVDERLESLVAASGKDARIVNATGSELPFSPRSFDTVVATLALCFTDDLAAAVADIARVLRPGGRLLFLEHVRSPTPGLARWQDRLSPAWHAIAVGCNCNYDTLASIEASPLRVEWYERSVLPLFPPLVRPLIFGTAIAPT